MLEKAGAIIAAIFVLVLLSAGALTIHYINYAVVPPVDAEFTASLPTSAPSQSWIPRISSPQAVLVLDVSGSMGLIRRSSDPGRLQSVAALQFFETFLKMSQEVLQDGDRAGIAVVLFGTVAQTVDWEDRGGLYLEVTEENRTLFRETIFHYLGRPEAWGGAGQEDPRRSQDTDYSAALEAVDELVSDSVSPPAVLFMTDGTMVAHPCFTPLLAEEVRRRLRRCRGGVPVPSRLSASSRTAVFNRRDGERPINKVTTSEDIDFAGEVAGRVSALLQRRYAVAGTGGIGSDMKAPLAWFPIFLDIRDRSQDMDAVTRMLNGDGTSQRYWNSTAGVIHCLTADDMVRQYVAALARWFRMFELPILPGEIRFRVPVNTQAMAVQVESELELDALRLVQGDREIPLTGRGKFWGGVVTGDCAGEWFFSPASTTHLKSSVFVRPRFDWVLAVPEICAQDPQGKAPQAHIYLSRISDGGVVPGGDVYSDLPEVLSGAIQLADGDTLSVAFNRSMDSQSDLKPTYVAEIPVIGVSVGPAVLSVRLDELEQRNVPLRTAELASSFEVADHTRLVVLDHRNRRSGRIQLENVPRAPQWAARTEKKTP